MESNDKLKEIDIKNCIFYYFDDMIKIEDLDLDNILINKKSYENILFYNISYKDLIIKPLCITFGKMDGFIIVYNGTRYLVLFESEIQDSNYSKTRYLISIKLGITYIISHNYTKVKVDSYKSLPLAKTITFHNIIILIESIWNKDKNNYYYKIFLEKASYDSPKN